MIDLVFEIRDRKIINSQDLKIIFQRLKDGKHQITIQDLRKRSLSQNDYYWSVVVPMCRVGLYNAGYDEIKQDQDAHKALKNLFIPKNMGKKNESTTTKLTVVGMDQYLESIAKWAAEYLSVVIPTPNQESMQLAKYTPDCEQMVEE